MKVTYRSHDPTQAVAVESTCKYKVMLLHADMSQSYPIQSYDSDSESDSDYDYGELY